jgi:hypothetical protein
VEWNLEGLSGGVFMERDGRTGGVCSAQLLERAPWKESGEDLQCSA